MKHFDPQLVWAFSGVLGLLAVSSLIGFALKLAVKKPEAQATIHNLNARIAAWWVMSAIFGLTMLVGQIGSLILFGMMSLLALREYVTLLPTRRADHRTNSQGADGSLHEPTAFTGTSHAAGGVGRRTDRVRRPARPGELALLQHVRTDGWR